MAKVVMNMDQNLVMYKSFCYCATYSRNKKDPIQNSHQNYRQSQGHSTEQAELILENLKLFLEKNLN